MSIEDKFTEEEKDHIIAEVDRERIDKVLLNRDDDKLLDFNWDCYEKYKIIMQDDSISFDDFADNDEAYQMILDGRISIGDSRVMEFVEKYISSRYVHVDSDLSLPLRPKEDVIAELKSLVGDKYIKIEKMMTILEANLAKDLDEMIFFKSIDVQGFTVIKNLGRGAFKKAYLAKDLQLDVELVLLQIDPNSHGYQHTAQIYKGLTEEQIMLKIVEDEFSAARVSRLVDDKRFIAILESPREGTYAGKKAIFIPTMAYDHTLQEEMDAGLINLRDANKYFFQISTALLNCFMEGIVHKDLKPDNIGITAKGNVLVTDFGCISMFSEGSDSRYQFPLHLRPPELAYSEEHWKLQGVVDQSELFTPEANAWTAAVIYYMMITGEPIVEKPSPRAEIGTPEYYAQNERVYEQIRRLLVINREWTGKDYDSIIDQLRSADRETWEEIIEEYTPLGRKICNLMHINQHAADRIYQIFFYGIEDRVMNLCMARNSLVGDDVIHIFGEDIKLRKK